MIRVPGFVVPLMLLIVVTGCGGGSASQGAVSSSEGSVAKGLEAAAASDWATAEEELDGAMQAGALQPDMAEQAMLTLAKARIELGKTDEAAALITQLEGGAAEMDQVLLVKTLLLIKKGDSAGAKAAFSEAQKLNKSLQPPAGL